MVDYNALLKVGRELLIAIGEDPEREGLRDTPRTLSGLTLEYMSYIMYLSSYKSALKANVKGVDMTIVKCQPGCTCKRHGCKPGCTCGKHTSRSLEDMTGRRFTRLVVLSIFGSDKKGNRLLVCQCDCGKQTVVRRQDLLRERAHSCGCLPTGRKRLPVNRKCSNPECDECDPAKFRYSKRNGERYSLCIECNKAKSKQYRQMIMQDEERAQRYAQRNRESSAEYRRLHPEAYQEGADRRENNRYKKQYGVSLDAVRRMAEELQNKCMICGTMTKLTIDHCHTRGVFRGLLCGDCNRALGLFHDNPDSLRKAADYLEMDRSEWIDGW